VAWSRQLHLRYGDLDYLGHVTAAAYLAHFEETRSAWIAEILDIRFPIYVVAHQEIEYLREVLLEDSPLTITVAVSKIGRSSMVIAETLLSRDGTLHARSRATLVMWDREIRRPRPMTERERTAFSAALDVTT